MVGYMQGSKRARHTPSISNQTSIYGIMGGLASRTGVSNVATYNHIRIKGGQGLPELNGKTPTYQKNYMKANNLLSVNPLGAGGVGRMNLLIH